MQVQTCFRHIADPKGTVFLLGMELKHPVGGVNHPHFHLNRYGPKISSAPPAWLLNHVVIFHPGSGGADETHDRRLLALLAGSTRLGRSGPGASWPLS